MNEDYPDREGCCVVVVFDLAEIVTLGQSPQHLRADGSCSGDDEVGMAEEDLDEGGAVVETCIQEKEIALLEALDELKDEFMFRSACLAEDEAQGGTTDEVKETAKLDGDCPQSLLALVAAERLPKGMRFRQCESGFIPRKQAQSVPPAALLLTGSLQPRYQGSVHPGESLQGKNVHGPCRRRPRKWTIGCQAVQ